MAKKRNFTFASADGKTQIYVTEWKPETGAVLGVLQISHGMLEFMDRDEDFAKFLTENEALIRKQYGFTRTADEIFIQTLAMKSPFRDSLYTHGVHYIDWERGEPYTFTAEDFELLINSGKPFARKFDCRQDSEIIQRIYNHVKNIEQRS